MHYTIEKLMFSTEPIQQYFVAARDKWKELLDRHKDSSVEELAEAITHAQSWFEHNCGSRWPGQEVMVWSAFGYLYTTVSGFEGKEPLAEKVARAFEASMCSAEVKSHARDAVESYGVDVDIDLLKR